MDGTDLEVIFSLSIQRAFVQNLDSSHTVEVPKSVDDGEKDGHFKALVSAKEAALSSSRRGKFLQV